MVVNMIFFGVMQAIGYNDILWCKATYSTYVHHINYILLVL